MLNLRLIKFCLFYPIIHLCIFLFNLLKGFLDFIFLSLCYHISNFLFFDCSPFCSILFMFQDGISLPSSPRLSMIVSLKFLLLFAPSLFPSSLFLLLWPLLHLEASLKCLGMALCLGLDTPSRRHSPGTWRALSMEENVSQPWSWAHPAQNPAPYLPALDYNRVSPLSIGFSLSEIRITIYPCRTAKGKCLAQNRHAENVISQPSSSRSWSKVVSPYYLHWPLMRTPLPPLSFPIWRHVLMVTPLPIVEGRPS